MIAKLQSILLLEGRKHDAGMLTDSQLLPDLGQYAFSPTSVLLCVSLKKQHFIVDPKGNTRGTYPADVFCVMFNHPILHSVNALPKSWGIPMINTTMTFNINTG